MVRVAAAAAGRLPPSRRRDAQRAAAAQGERPLQARAGERRAASHPTSARLVYLRAGSPPSSRRPGPAGPAPLRALSGNFPAEALGSPGAGVRGTEPAVLGASASVRDSVVAPVWEPTLPGTLDSNSPE